MSLDEPQRNKMMQAAPAKKEFHFAGGGVWRNATIVAETIEEAQKLWHATKQLISAPSNDVKPDPQSTPAPEPQSGESEVQ